MVESKIPNFSRRGLLAAMPAVAVTLLSDANAMFTTAPDRPLVVNRFADIAEQQVLPAMPPIMTRGWGTAGTGAATYIHDSQVDDSYILKFPRSSIRTADGFGYRLAATDDPRQLGAVGDGRTDDSAAVNEALAQGGTVHLRGPATYFCSQRLIMAVPGTRLLLGESVVIRTSAWRYRGSQRPFGNAINITADDCEVIGSGPSSVVDSVKSDANGIGFLHCAGGRVTNLALRGGKRWADAITDDTFQSGISIINNRDANPSGRSSGTIVEDCLIEDWVQYGINVYGDLASGIILRRNIIRGIGKPDDKVSVGAGVALTRGVGPLLIEDNTISDNKGFGVFASSAGAQMNSLSILENRILRNGQDGIRISEELHFSGSGAIGQRGVIVKGNVIEANGAAGVRAGTFDGIGSIADLVIADNRIRANLGSGILVQANKAAGRGVNAKIENNELLDNGEFGLAVGSGSVAISFARNRFGGNVQGETADFRSGAQLPLREN